MPRQPDGNCWPQWLRKINAAENPRRVSSAGQWPPALAGKTAGDRLAGAAPCPRVAVSSQRAGCGKRGAWPGVSLLRGLGRHPATHRRGAGAGRAGGLAKTPIEALSGGQFQRMLFARVMVQQAPLVMLDEPFTGIDEATSRELMDLILEMHRQGQTIRRCCMITSGWPTFPRDAAADSPARLLGRYPGGAPGLQSCEVGMIWHTFFQPFIEFGFMRRALVVCLALSLSTTMLGVFLLLRRMSLMGDALSHAILPGVAVGYLLSGMSLLAMTLGGFIAGIVVARWPGG